MDNPFKFLKNEEWDALLAQGKALHFAPEAVIVEEGSKVKGILVIKKGEVKVCRDAAGFRLTVAEQGAGAIFGEMSFIESEPAEVVVVAATEVDAIMVGQDTMQAAIQKSPGLSGRFFQSLAWILSRRLRETTGRIKVGPKDDDWLGN